MLPVDLNFPPKPNSGSSGGGLRSSPPAGALPLPFPVGPPPPSGPQQCPPRPPSGPADSPPPLSVVADLNYPRPKSNSGSSLAQSPPVTPSSNPAAAAATAKEATMSGGASAAGSESPTHSQVTAALRPTISSLETRTCCSPADRAPAPASTLRSRPRPSNSRPLSTTSRSARSATPRPR